MKLCCLHVYRMTNSLRVVKKKESYLWKNEWNFTFVLLHMENTVKIYCTCIQTHLEYTRDLVHFKRLEFTSKPVCVCGGGWGFVYIVGTKCSYNDRKTWNWLHVRSSQWSQRGKWLNKHSKKSLNEKIQYKFISISNICSI